MRLTECLYRIIHRSWFKRALTVIFILGTAGAAVLWVAALTAKCEGFGCLGVGAMIAMTVMIQFATAILGGILIWVVSQENRPPTWLLAVETVHLMPLLWFGGRLLVS